MNNYFQMNKHKNLFYALFRDSDSITNQESASRAPAAGYFLISNSKKLKKRFRHFMLLNVYRQPIYKGFNFHVLSLINLFSRLFFFF